ncbi:MAG: hypothetical protein V7752_15765 [Halopseudomonas sp.]
MNFSMTEMIALQDVRVCERTAVKEITPTKFYALSSCMLASFGVYLITLLFSRVSLSASGLRTSDLVIQANFAIFILIALAVLVFPWMKMQRYQIRIKGENTRLFHYQEAIVVMFGILFVNIPLMFLAHSVAMYEMIAHAQTLNAEVLSYMQSSYFFHMPTLEDVLVCGLFGAVLLVIKVWVFMRVARRFIQNKRFRNVVR